MTLELCNPSDLRKALLFLSSVSNNIRVTLPEKLYNDLVKDIQPLPEKLYNDLSKKLQVEPSIYYSIEIEKE